MKESRSKAQKLQKFKSKILIRFKYSQTFSNTFQQKFLLKNKLPSASNETSNSSNSHQHPRNTIQTERFSNGKKSSSSSSSSFYHFYQIYRKGKKILESLILLTRDKRFTIQRDLLQSFEKKIPSQKTVYKLMFAEERLGPIARH